MFRPFWACYTIFAYIHISNPSVDIILLLRIMAQYCWKLWKRCWQFVVDIPNRISHPTRKIFWETIGVVWCAYGLQVSNRFIPMGVPKNVKFSISSKTCLQKMKNGKMNEDPTPIVYTVSCYYLCNVHACVITTCSRPHQCNSNACSTREVERENELQGWMERTKEWQKQ